MAFALTKAEFRSIAFQNVEYKRGMQEILLTITAANTDTALDLGTVAGTFWTAAQADATYGAMAALVLAKIQALVAAGAVNVRFACRELQNTAYIQVASTPSSNQYSLIQDTIGVSVTLHSGDAPTSYHVHLFYELAAGIFPVSGGFNL